MDNTDYAKGADRQLAYTRNEQCNDISWREQVTFNEMFATLGTLF